MYSVVTQSKRLFQYLPSSTTACPHSNTHTVSSHDTQTSFQRQSTSASKLVHVAWQPVPKMPVYSHRKQTQNYNVYTWRCVLTSTSNISHKLLFSYQKVIQQLTKHNPAVLTSGLLWVLSETGASNWQIIGDFFWRTAKPNGNITLVDHMTISTFFN